MEYALSDRAPYFAGGLGVLAADYLLESGKQGKDFTAFGLAYQDNENALSSEGFVKKDLKISFLGKDILVWEKDFGSAKLYLLDAGELTRIPYGPDYWTTIKQQLILAFGSIKLIKLLNLKPDVYHLNEGHTAFVAWALKEDAIAPQMAGLQHDEPRHPGTSETSDRIYPGTKEDAIASLQHDEISLQNDIIVATKHTILSQSGLFIPKGDMQKIYEMCKAETNESFDDFYQQGSDENHQHLFSTNKYLFKYAVKSSGVSKLHTEFEKNVHPNSPLIAITNGINPDRWQSKLPHSEDKKALCDFFSLDENLLTIVWARRLVDYKQPELIFTDLARLPKNVQFILAANVHTSDPASVAIAARINNFIKDRPIIFYPNYCLSTAQMLTKGADIWLNTPLVGKEACGTSGMKAGINGALMVSTPDGWIVENDWNDLGWILSTENTADSFYNALEKEIVPLYYDNPQLWEAQMQKTIKIIEEKYTTARMLADYWEKLY